MNINRANIVGTDENDTYIIEYRPTSKCNYNCYYCTDLHDNKNPIIRNRIAGIEEIITAAKKYKKKKVSLYIYGGEPTLHPDLTKTINMISNHMDSNDVIEVQTNLSRPINWLKEFVVQVDTSKLKISVSYHNTQPVSITDFLKKCMFLKTRELLSLVSVMWNNRKSPIKDYMTLSRHLGVDLCELAPLIQQTTPNQELDGEIDYFYSYINNEDIDQHKHSFDKSIKYEFTDRVEYFSRNKIWKDRMNRFKGYTCEVLNDKLYIDWNGECYPCVNDMLDSDIACLFNINSLNIRDVAKYLLKGKCTCVHTTCPFDINSLKYK